MAISVDTVYQRVLALANKEQRGYVTPQEFNLLANQAQMSIFESYFYAKNQRERAELARTNEVNEADIGELLDRKLGPFQSFEDVTSGTTFPSVTTSGSHVEYFKLAWFYLVMSLVKRLAFLKHNDSNLQLDIWLQQLA